MKKEITGTNSRVTPYDELLRQRKELVSEQGGQFGSVEHQLEFIGVIDGVTYINDSRSSDVNSTWYALNKMKSPVIWIAGGADRGIDFSTLSEIVKEKVKAIVCIGENNENLFNSFHRDIPMMITRADSALEAVQCAKILGKSGDVVLLSPACPAYDRFKNSDDRGNQFREAVNSLKWKAL